MALAYLFHGLEDVLDSIQYPSLELKTVSSLSERKESRHPHR